MRQTSSSVDSASAPVPPLLQTRLTPVESGGGDPSMEDLENGGDFFVASPNVTEKVLFRTTERACCNFVLLLNQDNLFLLISPQQNVAD
jgi:hypothetical protein